MKIIKSWFLVLTLISSMSLTACAGGIGIGGGFISGSWDEDGNFNGIGQENWLEILFG